ncbi:hypothetical protein BATDEDRAFT_23170 [Batrachochytrium dendrobatidis JAM81]|uniref:Uncharacterized protein n=2 Tax=Batrachochytrium dendrobatidis TaxID=109871 RepID=F4NWY0_BATDJ|nr:uncharacterized protein BATDEDRAFT_23170 [Batrachochytrium dendrobatidis JAM81]EGF82569.1 hypothetical protein BATDEDRAFT_23170 [Batrachochytrium dendrobatidis JAM81]KAK5667191.1 hypothetical protein QVD99_006399 [Batrachochytrium dendrobatidis]|eukprot:XP_006676716.1 hypothetical protein BATDEDRAFT_23170 [Batrachochytrium dendrobatidis JAM81]
MKLSITVLSSILAICSVTTASPVNPNLTMGAGADASTASPSAAQTRGPNYASLSGPYDLKKYCGPFDATEVSLISDIAENQARIKKMFSKFDNLRRQVFAQKMMIMKIGQKNEALYQASRGEFGSAETRLEIHRGALSQLKNKLKKLREKSLDMTEKDKTWKKRLTRHLFGSQENDGIPLETVFGYDECFNYFHSRFFHTVQ